MVTRADSKISRVRYRHGMLASLGDRDSCGEVVFEAPDISASIVSAIAANRILELPGTYGDPEMGTPIEYDEVTIDYEDGSITIEFFNRAISLFTSDSEVVRRIHRALCVIDDHAS